MIDGTVSHYLSKDLPDLDALRLFEADKKQSKAAGVYAKHSPSANFVPLAVDEVFDASYVKLSLRPSVTQIVGVMNLLMQHMMIVLVVL